MLERLWIVGSIAYGGLRIFVADRTVRRYGVNIWAFGCVELSTSWVYGLSTARVVGALVDRKMRPAVRWGAAAAGSFLAPESFVVLTGRHMPLAVYLVVAGLLTTLGTAATVSLVRNVRAARAARAVAAAEAVAATVIPQ